MIWLRLLHIVLGTFWAGTLIFVALFLEPSVREAGPDGAKVMQGLMRRKFLNVLPLVALLTIVSGAWMLWIVSGRFDPAYMGSPLGIGISTGALLAFVAFLFGVGVMRPASLRAMALAQAAAALADSPDKAGKLAEAQRLRLRAGRAGRMVATLLALAAAAMAVARYL